MTTLILNDIETLTEVKHLIANIPWTSDAISIEEKEVWIRELNSFDRDLNSIKENLSKFFLDHPLAAQLLTLHLENLMDKEAFIRNKIDRFKNLIPVATFSFQSSGSIINNL